MTYLALKLGRECPHCGDDLTVVFRRDTSRPTSPLQAAVIHGLLEHLSISPHWQDIGGFDDLVKLPDEPRPWEVHPDG